MTITILTDTKDVSSIYARYKLRVRNPFQEPLCLNGMSSGQNVCFVLIEINNCFLLSLFSLDNASGVATCQVSGDPFIMSDDDLTSLTDMPAICAGISLRLGKLLYFPLVYEDSPSFILLNNQQEGISWNRLPSPVISKQSLTTGLVEIATGRIGSHATRRIKRCKSYPFQMVEEKGTAAMDMIGEIERLSWKAKAGQDMISKKQMATYLGLSRSPGSLIRFILDKETPVAYRFDYKVEDIVYSLKWSYNEAYKKYSPGFYLMVEDMPACWKEEQIRWVDLHGSPDTLKDAVCEQHVFRKRSDFAWPVNNFIIESIRAERLLHDEKINTAYLNHTSLKSLY